MLASRRQRAFYSLFYNDLAGFSSRRFLAILWPVEEKLRLFEKLFDK